MSRETSCQKGAWWWRWRDEPARDDDILGHPARAGPVSSEPHVPSGAHEPQRRCWLRMSTPRRHHPDTGGPVAQHPRKRFDARARYQADKPHADVGGSSVMGSAAGSSNQQGASIEPHFTRRPAWPDAHGQFSPRYGRVSPLASKRPGAAVGSHGAVLRSTRAPGDQGDHLRVGRCQRRATP